MNYTEIAQQAEGLLNELEVYPELARSVPGNTLAEPVHLEDRSLEYKNPLECPVCHIGRVRKKMTRGRVYFYGCSRYPKCKYFARR
jgi:hypothetical protein